MSERRVVVGLKRYLSDYLDELNMVSEQIEPHEFERLVCELRAAYHRNANIFVFGNGGSASTASHFTCDLKKMAAPGGNRRFRIFCLTDNIPMVLAYANDVSYEDIFVEQIKDCLGAGDLVIGISGSGNSENVLRAIDYSNRNGVRTFGICGFGGGRMKETARNSIVVKCADMQKVEDLHMIILHCALQCLIKEVPAESLARVIEGNVSCAR